VAFDGRIVPLAADFTVPLAVMLQESDPKMGLVDEVGVPCLLRNISLPTALKTVQEPTSLGRTSTLAGDREGRALAKIVPAPRANPRCRRGVPTAGSACKV
jgi:hypothetical protein